MHLVCISNLELQIEWCGVPLNKHFTDKRLQNALEAPLENSILYDKYNQI